MLHGSLLQYIQGIFTWHRNNIWNRGLCVCGYIQGKEREKEQEKRERRNRKGEKEGTEIREGERGSWLH